MIVGGVVVDFLAIFFRAPGEFSAGGAVPVYALVAMNFVARDFESSGPSAAAVLESRQRRIGHGRWKMRNRRGRDRNDRQHQARGVLATQVEHRGQRIWRGPEHGPGAV